MNLCYVIKWPNTMYFLYAIVNFLVLIFPIVMQGTTLGGNGLKGTWGLLCTMFAVSCKSAIISKLKILNIVLQILAENGLSWAQAETTGRPFQLCWWERWNIRCKELEKEKLKNTQDFCFSSWLDLQPLSGFKLLMCIGLGVAGEE